MAVPRILKFLLWCLASLVLFTLLVAAALIYVPPPVERWLQDRVVGALQQRYGPNVQLKNLQVTIVPEFSSDRGRLHPAQPSVRLAAIHHHQTPDRYGTTNSAPPQTRTPLDGEA